MTFWLGLREREREKEREGENERAEQRDRRMSKRVESGRGEEVSWRLKKG